MDHTHFFQTLRRICKIAFKSFLVCILAFFILSTLQVTVYKFVNPPFSNLMLIRKWEAYRSGNKDFKVNYQFVPYKKISKNLKKAVLIAEDHTFFEHHGVIFKNLKLAMESYFKQSKDFPYVFGYSTLTQQTAKNVFLYPKKTLLRKALEIHYSLLMELIWGKRRILEVYLNVAEFGDGIFGVGAAAKRYYKKTPGLISKKQASLMVSVLTNPRKYLIENPTPALLYRASKHFKKMESPLLPKSIASLR